MGGTWITFFTDQVPSYIGEGREEVYLSELGTGKGQTLGLLARVSFPASP